MEIKGFLKRVITIMATLVATMAIGSVAVHAAVVTYNMADAIGLTVNEYGGTIAGSTVSTVISPTGSANTITAIKDVKPALISYNNETASGKGYITAAPTEGTLADTLMQTAVYTTSGTTKDFLTISDVPANSLIEVYYYGCDSKGASGKATSMDIKDTANTQTYSVAAGNANTVNYASFTSTVGGTVTIATKGTRVGVTAIVITSGGSVVTWPDASTQTSATTMLYGGTATNILSGNTLTGATNVGGSASNKARIRIGKEAYGESTDTPTSANCGYITFDLTEASNVAITAASSGSTSSRTFYLGSFDGTNFTDIAEITVTGNVGEVVTTEVPGAGTYAVYTKPKNVTDEITGVTSTLPAENTDIKNIDIATIGSIYATTPELTLGTVTVADGNMTVTGKFNDFTGTAFEVQSISLKSAIQNSTDWTPNEITILKDNGDGTVEFTATGTYTAESSYKFQAIATYNGIAEATISIQGDEAVSNVATYTYIAPEA